MGVFIAPPNKQAPSKKARRERLQSEVDRLLVSAVCLGFSSEELREFIDERAKQYQWNYAAAGA